MTMTTTEGVAADMVLTIEELRATAGAKRATLAALEAFRAYERAVDGRAPPELLAPLERANDASAAAALRAHEQLTRLFRAAAAPKEPGQ